MEERLYRIRAPRPGPRLEKPAERPWRSLGELERGAAATPEVPPGAVPEGVIDRRGFIRVAGATLAAAGCAVEVPRKILPYTRQPPDVVPGMSSFYATSMVLDGYARGLLVQSREGRPIKIEANPDHPATLGGTTMFEQASIRQLYDDCRGRQVRYDGEPSSWEDLLAALRLPRADRGAGLRILLEPTASPSLLATLDRVRARFPEARAAFHAPIRQESAAQGARLAYGRPLLPQLDLSRAEAIVALDADFLTDLPFSVRYARQWAERRRLASAQGTPNRLYAVESQLSVTGSMADNRLRRPLSQIPVAATALARAMDFRGALGGAARHAPASGDVETWAKAVAADLLARPRGNTAILVGDRQPPAIHALAYAMNEALGNVGRTVSFTEPVLPSPGDAWVSFDDLVAEMRGGQVDTLVVLDVNPVYTAPADLGFREALGRVPDAICLAAYEHETAERCRWYAPAAHFLETWGDGRAYDGTLSMVQPLIGPLVDARSPLELLAALGGDAFPDGRRLLHEHWTASGRLSEAEWLRALQRGIVAGSASPAVAPALDPSTVARALTALPPPAPGAAIEIELYPSPTVYDGRFANNPWLLEQPTPIGKLTWDNAALVSPETARALGVKDGQVLDIRVTHAAVSGPVLIVPGLADGVAALWLGYGRRGQERTAAGVGFNAYPLRTRAHLHVVPDARVTARKETHELALTQEHWYTHDRPIALHATLGEYRRDPNFTEAYRGPVPSMLPEVEYGGNQWAMSIDLSICTGCSACTIACQAENNVPIVTRAEVRKSREMNWLRIDTYFFGAPAEPRLVHQPMMCQHCEKAPCEYVCPVEATVHSPDGLNEMVYNRCVGTRFCSNNCPYKVRRFNWFDWGERVDLNRGLAELQYNPDVTVRERGVMEKCTYCVQRIRRAEIEAELDGRELGPGDVVTACQAACPTGAIQFDSLAHRDTDMVRWREQDRSYAVLQQEEGTQPRTYYLARIDNPNPELG